MNPVDTDVLVDCLGGTGPGRVWLEQLARESFTIPGVVAMELVMGCRDREDLERIQKFPGTLARGV